MKRLFNLVLTLVALMAIAYPFRNEIEGALRNLFYVPCARPITYALGSIDDRFGVSNKYFLDAIDDAIDIWEKPMGKDLFSYSSDKGELTINLVFDYRELVTTKLAVIDDALKGDQALYDSMKARYESLKSQYARLDAEYNPRVAVYEQRRKAYEKQVSSLNARGGANQKQYSELESERKSLQAEVAELQAMQLEINGIVDELNGLVDELNRLADSLNLNVEKYNTIDATRGDTFEQGLYESDGFRKKIDIYEFSDRTKLVRVLAHELGHALGLGHVTDPEAIMYEINQGEEESLVQDDIDALKAHCGIK